MLDRTDLVGERSWQHAHRPQLWLLGLAVAAVIVLAVWVIAR